MRLRSLVLLFTCVGCGGPLASQGHNDGGVDAGNLVGCDPNATPDPCASGGEACTPDYTGESSTGFACALPGPFFDCVPAIGCAGTSTCVDAGEGQPGECLQTCTTSAECADPFTVCASLSPTGPGFCLINLCNDFWQPCPGQTGDGGDGTCVFLYVDQIYGPVGACLQAGGAGPNGTCAYYRDGGAPLCPTGTICALQDGVGALGDCLPLCDDAADGGPACEGVCIGTNPPTPPPAVSALDFGVHAGACAGVCDEADNCPEPYECEQLTSGQLLCLP